MGDGWRIRSPALRGAIQVQADLRATIEERRLRVLDRPLLHAGPDLLVEPRGVPGAVDAEVNAGPVDRVKETIPLTEPRPDEDDIMRGHAGIDRPIGAMHQRIPRVWQVPEVR